MTNDLRPTRKVAHYGEFLALDGDHVHHGRHRTVGIVGEVMAGQSTRACSAIVGNRRTKITGRSIRRHNLQIEVDHPLTGHVGCAWLHAMRRVTDRAGKSRVDVERMLAEARIGKNVSQIVAFRA